MTPADVERDYRTRLEARREALAARERTHARYAYARLALFAGAAAILVFAGFRHADWLLVPIVLFGALAFAHARVLNARDRAASAVAFYERGLDRLAHRWMGHGRDGAHLAPERHLYAQDLDIFGRGSLFELLATTRTHAGEETLARWLLEPADARVAVERQAAVRELARDLDLRERVAVMGDQLGIGVHAALLRRWSQSPIALRGIAIPVALGAIVLFTLTTGYWWYVTDHGALLLVAIALQLSVGALFRARVHQVVEAVAAPLHDLDLLADLLRAIETGAFTAPRLQALQAAVRQSGRHASQEIASLSRRVGMLSMRENVYTAIPSAVLMWGTQWAFATERWRAKAGPGIPDWLDAVGEFEALLALATFAAEHPQHVFPEFADPQPAADTFPMEPRVFRPGDTALFHATDLAHPALGPDAVPNSIAIGADAPQLFIVSGSNMSGKSTFLRTIGVSVVLAHAGAPVRATACRLSPLSIGASIQVRDSLADGQSHFFAEITRVKAIVDLADAHPGGVVFLLDEILSGTNSHDRRIGSEALAKSLVQSGAIGLITTHDLALGEIADRAPGVAVNVHFEDQFANGQLSFDYRLRPGIVKTSNALALMRAVGLRT